MRLILLLLAFFLLSQLSPKLSLAQSTDTATPARTWSDASGRFKIEAKLIDQNETHVRLLKSDGLAVNVPLNVLSDTDKQYLKDLAAQNENPFAGGAPMETATTQSILKPDSSLLEPNANVTELPTDGEVLLIEVDNELPALQIDPMPYPAAKNFQGAWSLGPLDAYVKVSHPIVIDPSRGLFAISTNRTANAVADNQYGRIHLFGGSVRKTQLAMDLTPTLRLMDHHIATDRTLAVLGVGSNTQRGGDLVLFSGLSSGKPQPLVRWHLPEHDRPGFKPKVEFARLLSDTQAVVQVNSSIYLWDLAEGKCTWVIERIQSGAKIAVSGGGKYLAIPDGGGVRLIDIQGSELIGRIAFPSSLTPTPDFSPDGKQLAIVAGNQYVVWDLAKGSVSSEMTIGTSSGNFYGWVGNDYLLTQNGGLVDPQLRLSVWSYSLPSGTEPLTLPGGVIAIHKDYKISGAYGMPIPHAPVQAALKKLSGGDEKLMAVRPGTVVQLAVDAPDNVNSAEMMAGLKEAVEKVGWKVAAKSPITVTAKIQRGEKEDYNFRSMGTSRLNTPSKAISIRPYKASLRITQGSTELWTEGTSKMVPFMVRLSRDQTIEEKMKEYEKPDPGYFKRITLPSRILRADISKTVGRSRLKNGSWQ